MLFQLFGLNTKNGGNKASLKNGRKFMNAYKVEYKDIIGFLFKTMKLTPIQTYLV
ncbi:hypothetical protein GAPWKB30_1834 [Gilliamella apicola]|nr:hypothetical protein GAPWKB30_1834 [Gilliamella apicola]